MPRYAVTYKDKEGFSRLQVLNTEANGDRLKRHLLSITGVPTEKDYKLIAFTDNKVVEQLAAKAKTENEAKVNAAVAQTDTAPHADTHAE